MSESNFNVVVAANVLIAQHWADNEGLQRTATGFKDDEGNDYKIVVSPRLLHGLLDRKLYIIAPQLEKTRAYAEFKEVFRHWRGEVVEVWEV